MKILTKKRKINKHEHLFLEMCKNHIKKIKKKLEIKNVNINCVLFGIINCDISWQDKKSKPVNISMFIDFLDTKNLKSFF